MSQAEIEFRLKTSAPTSLSLFVPSWQATFAQYCRWLAVVDQELARQSQQINEEAAEEEAALAESSNAGQLCEQVLQNSTSEWCIDLFVRQRELLRILSGDDRPPNSGAPRNQSRVQLNFDPENLSFNAFINGTTVNIVQGWQISYLPDGVTYLNTDPDSTRPASAKRLTLQRVNGDPNTAELSYSFANQVCAGSTPTIMCPDIDGRLRFKKVNGTWSIDL